MIDTSRRPLIAARDLVDEVIGSSEEFDLHVVDIMTYQEQHLSRPLPSFFALPSLQPSQLKSTSAKGHWRTRLPVAAKMALHTAGANGGKAGSPKPVTG